MPEPRDPTREEFTAASERVMNYAPDDISRDDFYRLIEQELSAQPTGDYGPPVPPTTGKKIGQFAGSALANIPSGFVGALRTIPQSFRAAGSLMMGNPAPMVEMGQGIVEGLGQGGRDIVSGDPGRMGAATGQLIGGALVPGIPKAVRGIPRGMIRAGRFAERAGAATERVGPWMGTGGVVMGNPAAVAGSLIPLAAKHGGRLMTRTGERLEKGLTRMEDTIAQGRTKRRLQQEFNATQPAVLKREAEQSAQIAQAARGAADARLRQGGTPGTYAHPATIGPPPWRQPSAEGLPSWVERQRIDPTPQTIPVRSVPTGGPPVSPASGTFANPATLPELAPRMAPPAMPPQSGAAPAFTLDKIGKQRLAERVSNMVRRGAHDELQAFIAGAGPEAKAFIVQHLLKGR